VGLLSGKAGDDATGKVVCAGSKEVLKKEKKFFFLVIVFSAQCFADSPPVYMSYGEVFNGLCITTPGLNFVCFFSFSFSFFFSSFTH
jgi:hypothetical protein